MKQEQGHTSTDSERKLIEDIFGKGKGPHAGVKARKHKNKFKKNEGKGEDEEALDPFEMQKKIAQEELKRQEKGLGEETREEERQRLRATGATRERGRVNFPDESTIDPYDPTTFGFVRVGEILGAHGLKGEVKVRASTDFGTLRLCKPGVKHLQQPGRRFPRAIQLQAGRLQVDDLYIVKFKGVMTRDLAAELRGYQLFVKETDEIEKDEEEFLVQELVGLRVFLAEDESKFVGNIVGLVLGEDISSVPGMSDLLEIQYQVQPSGPGSYNVPGTMSLYIPFVKQIVPHVDVREGRVLITPPAGLLDLAVLKEEPVFIRGYLSEARCKD